MESVETLLFEHLDELRLDVLRRLAEQAMTDEAFRAVARHDMLAALDQFGYDLNEHELALALRFRDALAEAGVDLFLDDKLQSNYEALLQKLAL